MTTQACIKKSPAVGRDDVAFQISEFILRMETERVRLFRLYLQTTLRRVSPLLIDLAAYEDIQLVDAIALIQPPLTWPRRPLNSSARANPYQSPWTKHWLRAFATRAAWHFERAFADPGVVIREAGHPKGRFAIRPCGTVLGFTAAIGPCFLSAFGPTAYLKLPEPLPETLLASMPGRLLNDVVQHPIFGKRSYVIRRASTDSFDSLPVLAFKARTLPFAGPWGAAAIQA